jgi:hypothetical protein
LCTPAEEDEDEADDEAADPVALAEAELDEEPEPPYWGLARTEVAKADSSRVVDVKNECIVLLVWVVFLGEMVEVARSMMNWTLVLEYSNVLSVYMV